MKYPYTLENRLEVPHKYMYTPFEGISLLSAYESDRVDLLNQISVIQPNDAQILIYESRTISLISESLKVALNLLGAEQVALFDIMKSRLVKTPSPCESIIDLNAFDSRQQVEVTPLLNALISSQLRGNDKILVKKWLDLLVQRFEVAKKIYSAYQSGFRKGEGDYENVLLYWLFALALILHYAVNKQLKFLSTLLKVVDLLSSLPPTKRFCVLSKDTMSLIVLAEMASVIELSNARGIHLDS